MTDLVEVYARPYTFEVKSEGQSSFVADPQFDPNSTPHIIIPRDVAQESLFIMDLIEEFSNSEKAPLIQVDNVNHSDLENIFQLLQVIRDVLGPYVRPSPATINNKGETVESAKSPSRERPHNDNLSDEKADLEKEEDARISNYIASVVADGTPEGNMRLLIQMLLTTNFLIAVRAVNFLGKHVADLIKGKSPEEIRKQFAVRLE